MVDRPLVLGGVIIPHHRGLEGHSDADVLLHAVCDALLGAAGRGDIGRHFPDTDSQYEGIQSTKLLAQVFQMIVKDGYMVGNVDAVIITEAPKLAPHIPAMRARIARILVIDESDVSVKATSNEKMGFVGREEGMAVIATVLVYKDDGTIASTDQ